MGLQTKETFSRSHTLLQQLESSEQQYFKEFVQNCSPLLKRRLGVNYKELEKGVGCFSMTGHDILAFNRVISAGLHSSITEGLLNEIKHYYRSLNIPRFFLTVPPFVETAGLERLLLENGFLRYNHWAKLGNYFSRIEKTSSNEIQIREATTNDRELIANIFAQAFDFPTDIGSFFCSTLGQNGWKFYIASYNHTAIAAAGLHINGRIGSLTIAGTLPEFRGLNAQKLLINKRISVALAAGCRFIKAETGEDTSEKPNYSYRNMLKAGLKRIYLRSNFICYPL